MISSQAGFSLRGRNPDVLTCIANLSNDEVFTPPDIAKKILDILEDSWAADNNGANIWADPSVRFLDPFTKSGVFLREITSRLNKGLEPQFPVLKERIAHILSNKRAGNSPLRLEVNDVHRDHGYEHFRSSHLQQLTYAVFIKPNTIATECRSPSWSLVRRETSYPEFSSTRADSALRQGALSRPLPQPVSPSEALLQLSLG